MSNDQRNDGWGEIRTREGCYTPHAFQTGLANGANDPQRSVAGGEPHAVRSVAPEMERKSAFARTHDVHTAPLCGVKQGSPAPAEPAAPHVISSGVHTAPGAVGTTPSTASAGRGAGPTDAPLGVCQSDCPPDAERPVDEPHQDSAAAPRPFDGEAGFARWFIANYPPGCTIHNPAWHAPKIWRAALSHRESGR